MMPYDPKETAELLRFQLSLLRLLSREMTEQEKSMGPVSVCARRLENWAKKVDDKARSVAS